MIINDLHTWLRNATQFERKGIRQAMRDHAKGNKDSYFMSLYVLRWHAHPTNYWYFT